MTVLSQKKKKKNPWTTTNFNAFLQNKLGFAFAYLRRNVLNVLFKQHNNVGQNLRLFDF